MNKGKPLSEIQAILEDELVGNIKDFERCTKRLKELEIKNKIKWITQKLKLNKKIHVNLKYPELMNGKYVLKGRIIEDEELLKEFE